MVSVFMVFVNSNHSACVSTAPSKSLLEFDHACMLLVFSLHHWCWLLNLEFCLVIEFQFVSKNLLE